MSERTTLVLIYECEDCWHVWMVTTATDAPSLPCERCMGGNTHTLMAVEVEVEP